MTLPNGARYQTAKAAFEAAGQEHVFSFWDELNDGQRRELLDDLDHIDIHQLAEALENMPTRSLSNRELDQILPAPIIPRASVRRSIIESGYRLIGEGRVAALTVAGGQGTRLGFDGPKGAFPISPVRRKSLFQLFAESILATERRCDTEIRWYIMTSSANDQATRSFFDEHGFFGLSPQRVRFFQQGVMPAIDDRGRIILASKHRVALSPDGHGGTLSALAATGMLAEMAARGVEQISYFQVDNPLVSCIDPTFIGLHAAEESEMSSKIVPKADDLERVGNFVLLDDGLRVIEYFDFPEDLARQRNADGTRRFDAANIAVHIFSRAFVERLTAGGSVDALRWHAAKKKVPCIDLCTGDPIEPTEPNAFKLERFIFDALPHAKKAILLATTREEAFSPVKNMAGVDSVDSARRNMSRRAARWLEAAGMPVRRDARGEPVGQYEISPLTALDAAELAERIQEDGALHSAASKPEEGIYLGEKRGHH